MKDYTKEIRLILMDAFNEKTIEMKITQLNMLATKANYDGYLEAMEDSKEIIKRTFS